MDNVGTLLKGKTAGLPRWAWLGMLSGAVVVGLYLRNRSKSTEVGESSEGEESPEGLEEYNGTEAGASLAGAGLVGPASTTLTPVENPVVPAGIAEVLEGLGHVVEEQGKTIAEIKTPVVVEGGTTIPPESITGGGSPVTPPAAHVPPANCGKEISRLEGEISGLQAEIASLTASIKNLKAAKKPNTQAINQKEAQRAQAQGSVQYKQAKLGAQKVVCR